MFSRLLSFSLLCGAATAQTQLDWSNVVAPTGPSRTNAACFDVPNRTLYSGTVDSAGLEGFVRALDPQGAEVWTRNPQVAMRPLLVTDIAYDGAGRIAVAGVRLMPNGVFQGAGLVMYDVNGVELWSTSWQEPGGEQWISNSIAGFDAGGPVLAGPFPTGAGSNGGDLGLISLDASGSVRWLQALGGSGFDRLAGAELDSTGNLFVAGSSLFLPTFDEFAFLVKVTPSGSIAWHVNRADDVYIALALDGQDRPYVAGTRSAAGLTNLVIAGFDASTGAERFATALDGQGNLFGIAVAPDGVVVVTGERIIPAPISTSATFTVAVDAQGNELWRALHHPPQGTRSSIGRAVRIDAGGDVLITGAEKKDSDPEAKPLVIRYPRSIAPIEGWSSTQLPVNAAGPAFAFAFPVAATLDVDGSVRIGGTGSTAAVARQATAWRLVPDGRTSCVGDGSLVACPCSNSSTSFERAGCSNTVGFGGKLEWSGSASLAVDTLRLHASSMPATTTALFLQGAGSGVAPTPFGDGIACLAGPISRLRTVGAVQGRAVNPSGVGPVAISIQGSVTLAGSVRTYQARYRDAAPFCTTAGWNSTNAIEVTWRP